MAMPKGYYCNKCMRKANFKTPACIQYQYLMEKNHPLVDCMLALLFGCEYAQKMITFITQKADDIKPLLKGDE